MPMPKWGYLKHFTDMPIKMKGATKHPQFSVLFVGPGKILNVPISSGNWKRTNWHCFVNNSVDNKNH